MNVVKQTLFHSAFLYFWYMRQLRPKNDNSEKYFVFCFCHTHNPQSGWKYKWKCRKQREIFAKAKTEEKMKQKEERKKKKTFYLSYINAKPSGQTDVNCVAKLCKVWKRESESRRGCFMLFAWIVMLLVTGDGVLFVCSLLTVQCIHTYLFIYCITLLLNNTIWCQCVMTLLFVGARFAILSHSLSLSTLFIHLDVCRSSSIETFI